jgi:hypothetical protein
MTVAGVAIGWVIVSISFIESMQYFMLLPSLLALMRSLRDREVMSHSHKLVN